MTDEQKAFYEALGAADAAKADGLRGYYPRAVIVLADEVKRLRAMEQRVNVAKAMCDESVGGAIDPGTLRAVLWA